MKTKLILLLLCVNTYSFCQNRIKIDFNNKTSGDYDLIINDILKNNGYNSFVDYHPEKQKQGYDLFIKYNTTSRENYDELHTYSLAIYDSLGRKLNEVEKSISYFNLGVNEYKEMLKGLNKLLNKQFNYNESNTFKKVGNFNIQFNVQKLDSTTYSIVAKGAGIRPLIDVENAFLKKATEYLDGFDYYFENGNYTYHAPGPGAYMVHSGYVVLGIVKGNSKIDKTRTKLKIPPIEFNMKFKKNFK
ncbi:MAG: hypothetical protein PHT07_07640 [Paludibacter sp.]|nr:hypothetical protein [Paludibacter sp.]